MSFKNIKVLTVVYHCHIISLHIYAHICPYALLHIYCFCNTVPETVPVISLSRMENVILIQDQGFELTCSSVNINHDFYLNWSIPLESVRYTHLLHIKLLYYSA